MTTKTIVGRLGRDAETKATQSGKQVVSFSVAETKRRFDRDRIEWVDDFTLWHDVESWQNVNAIGALAKGALVIVVGEERDASYENRDTGKKVRRVVVRAQKVGELLTDRRNQGQQATGGSWGASQDSGSSWSAPSGNGAQTAAQGDGWGGAF